MYKINDKLLNKIGSNFLAQFPHYSLVQAYNAWINEYNAYLRERNEKGYKCLLNNCNCDGMAVNSHSIPKKNLKMMSNNRSVCVLKDDFKNPFKSDLSTSNIKSTLTFRGFCKYHDRSLFQGIENKNTTHYNVEDVFYFSYRAVAKEYSDNRELIEKYSWMNSSWKSEQKKRLDKEWAAFQSCRMKNIDKNLVQLKLKFWLIYRRLRNSRSSFASLNQNKEEFVQSTNSGMKSG